MKQDMHGRESKKEKKNAIKSAYGIKKCFAESICMRRKSQGMDEGQEDSRAAVSFVHPMAYGTALVKAGSYNGSKSNFTTDAAAGCSHVE